MINQEGRVFQIVTEPINVKNKDLVNIPGLEEIAVPFARATTKQGLTRVEEALKAFGSAVDKVVGTSFGSKIEDRKGSMLLSSHYITRPKMVMMNGDKLATNQNKYVNAELLWDRYHEINSFVEVNGVHNQYTIHPKKKLNFL